MSAFGVPAFVLPNIPPGKVVQIVSATTSTGVASSSATYADTGLTATITPTSAANKILVFASQSGVTKSTSNTGCGIRLFRGASLIQQMEVSATTTGTTADNFVCSVSIAMVDTPATMSTVVYKTTFNSSAGTASVTVQSNTAVSSIVLMEVTP